MITHYVGISLSASSSVESAVALRDALTKELIYIDKIFSINDLALFFENYNSLKNSVICVSIPWDNTMLDGKWRVHAKAYQVIDSESSFLNRNNWTANFSQRGCELLENLKKQGIDIFRFEIYLTRQKLKLYSNFKERSPADCRFLQDILKKEYGFDNLSSNMMPVAQLEAIIGTLLAEEYLKNNTKPIFDFKNLEVINIK